MTATFTASAAGTAESTWAPWVSGLPSLEIPDEVGHLLVVAAHPDDETLGSGGLVSLALRRGMAVDIVVASDGEASHPLSRTHTPAEIAARRRGEVAEAARRLGSGAVIHLLGLPDSGITGRTADLAAATESLVRDDSLVVTPWSRDRHPDHAACAAVGAHVADQRALPHWQYPLWAWHWGDPTCAELVDADVRGLVLDHEAQWAKAAALAEYPSQIVPLSALGGDDPVLDAAMLEHAARDVEVYVVRDPAPAARPVYFDALYARSADPWGLADRFYEQRKRAILMSALPRRRFRRAFEPGCATGLLTQELAERCDEVVAWDSAARAVELARDRTAGSRGRVLLAEGVIPASWPTGIFDLVVLSEVGYFCPDVAALADRVEACLSEDGVVVACHWRHPAPDHPTTAESVHAALGRRLRRTAVHLEADFVLEVWSRDGMSVAAAEGIVR